MELHLLISMISLILFVGVSASTVTPEEMYWKSALPDTPMPSAIKSSLQSVGNYGKTSSFRVSEVSTMSARNDNKNYKRVATRKEADDYMKTYGQTYMLETQMAPGSIIEVQLTGARADSISTFLPRKVADSIPFSTDKLPQILDRFSIDPKSSEALAMKNTIKECHEAKTYYCATSLEGMVDFVKSELGSNRLKSVSSTMLSRNTNKFGVKTAYKITGVDKLADYGSPFVVCHKQDYPYAVFYCHDLKMTAAYTVSLASNKEMVNVSTLAVCHKDTSWWDPMHLSFQMLKVKPGKATAICHFLEDRSVVWTKKI